MSRSSTATGDRVAPVAATWHFFFVKGISVMNDQLEETLATATSRRKIVRTGVKLAYAAPLVAVSFKVSQHGALAQAVSPGVCGHSIGGLGEGCKQACGMSGCSGGACNGFGDDPEDDPDPCDACNLPGGNLCPSADYCDPACFACDLDNDEATFIC